MEQEDRKEAALMSFMSWAAASPEQLERLGRSCLVQLLSALEGSEDDTVQAFVQACQKALKSTLIAERTAAWHESWEVPQEDEDEDSEDEYSGNQEPPRCMPVLRAEFNVRVFEFEYGEVLPKFDFGFTIDEHEEEAWYKADAEQRLNLELMVLSKIINLPEGWEYDNHHDELAVRNMFGQREFVTIDLLGLDAPGKQLIGNHGEVLKSLQESKLDAGFDISPLRTAVKKDLQLAAVTFSTLRRRYGKRIDLKRQRGRRVLMALLNKERFERLTGETLDSQVGFDCQYNDEDLEVESEDFFLEQAVFDCDTYKCRFFYVYDEDVPYSTTVIRAEFSTRDEEEPDAFVDLLWHM